MERSRREARSIMKQGGAYMNGTRVESFDRPVTLDDLGDDSTLLLRAGKKKFVRVVPSDTGGGS